VEEEDIKMKTGKTVYTIFIAVFLANVSTASAADWPDNSAFMQAADKRRNENFSRQDVIKSVPKIQITERIPGKPRIQIYVRRPRPGIIWNAYDNFAYDNFDLSGSQNSSRINEWFFLFPAEDSVPLL
jgi:hypothetical protein